MTIAVVCNTDSLAFPSIRFLKEEGLLVSVAIPDRSSSQLYEQLIRTGLRAADIIVLNSHAWQQQMKTWLETVTPDVVWVFAFPWKIPVDVLSVPTHGFLNFHFGLLPKYRGADPVFWQIKNKEDKCGLVIHKMTSDIDNGPVLWKEVVPSIPGENYGMNCIRMGFIAAGILGKLIDKLNDPTCVSEVQQHGESLFYNRPVVGDFTVNWQQHSAEDIEWLVNASNPKYDGAVTSLRGMEVRMLEVTPVEVNDQVVVEAGTIVHADDVYGLIVACSDKKFLRINILHLAEGYLSGVKLHSLGVRAGERLI